MTGEEYDAGPGRCGRLTPGQVWAHSWRCLLCAGASGFVYGLLLFLGRIVGGEDGLWWLPLCFGAALAGVFWKTGARIGRRCIDRVSNAVLPLSAAFMVLFPFVGESASGLFACWFGTLWGCVLGVVAARCAWALRAGRMGAWFVAPCAVIAAAPAVLGCLLGLGLPSVWELGVHPIAFIAVVVLFVTTCTAMLVHGRRMATGNEASGDGRCDAPGRVSRASVEHACPGVRAGVVAHTAPDTPVSGEPAAFRDRVSKQCAVLGKRYGLSQREQEIAEGFARGKTAQCMADDLEISLNTVRMHSKHLYAKLDIHKKQELLDMIDMLDIGELVC